MCLFIKNKENKKTPRIAEKAMKVYKCLQYYPRSDTCYAPYQTEFEYESYKSYPTVELRPERQYNHVAWRWELGVNGGYHAYTTFKAAWDRWGWEVQHPDKRCLFKSRKVIVEITIPKGAKYFLGKYNEIVASKIKTNQLRTYEMEE